MAARDNSGRLLLLFDIDGTLLVGAATAHARAIHRALAEIYGVEEPEAVRVTAAGRTDMEIARAILLRCGVSAERIDERAESFREASCAEYARLCPPSLADRVVPGMPELLAHLSQRDGVVPSLVTGNFEPIARLKLSRAGLGQYFRAGQGGFGSDSEDRTELPAIARRRAGALLAPRAGRSPQPYPRARTLVIGDTPRDIACARADGLRCIAVTTGPFAAEQLAQADAIASWAGELVALLEVELERERSLRE